MSPRPAARPACLGSLKAAALGSVRPPVCTATGLTAIAYAVAAAAAAQAAGGSAALCCTHPGGALWWRGGSRGRRGGSLAAVLSGDPAVALEEWKMGFFFVELYWAAFLGCASGRHILSHVHTQLLRHGPRLTEHVAAAAAPGRCAPAPDAGIQLTGLFVRIGRQNRV